uniref:Alpha-1,2-Mannosidase n=1 Tax=Panagrolaimus sp. JU765 TaxID=591449 RepID=A0AC34R7A7_9BILA
MKTVHPNKRVLIYLGLFASAIVLLLWIQILGSPTDGKRIPVPIVRDIDVRKQLEPKVIPGVDPPDFVDEKVEKSAEKGENLVKVEEEKEKVVAAAEPSKEVIAVPNNPDAEKLDKIREMMKFAWEGYKNYSWGANELRPIAKQAHSQSIFGGSAMGATIVDGADTLFIMGLTKEFEEAKKYIAETWSIKKATGQLSVFETTIRFIGGFLTLFALTGDEIFKTRAQETADVLMPAFDTPTGIAKSLINPATKTASNYHWASDNSILAEFGSLHLEFEYLSQITGNPIYKEKVQKIRDHLDGMDKFYGGLFYNYVSPNTGKFANSHVSLGALGDSFYEYLIKSYLLTNKTDEQALKMHKDASNAIQEHMIFTSKSGLKYIAELRSGSPEHKMGHLACFTPGMFALESMVEKNDERKKKLVQVAEDLANTCHESYVRSETRIGPEMFYFNNHDDATSKRSENGYILRPEVLEGFFYLWRITGNQKYKDWVWDGISAIDKHCKSAAGYAGLKNVYKPEAGFDDVQQSFFLAETLKYAYLTFDNDAIPLDKYVFNTEAHPFPIFQP